MDHLSKMVTVTVKVVRKTMKVNKQKKKIVIPNLSYCMYTR